MWLPVGRPNSKGRDIFFDRPVNGKMILTTHKDMVYSRKHKLKRKCDVENFEQPTTTKINVTVDDDEVLLVPSKVRSFKVVTNTAIEDDSSDTGEEDKK